jgi:hypothetical protein
MMMSDDGEDEEDLTTMGWRIGHGVSQMTIVST